MPLEATVGSRTPRERIAAIDVARGAAMLFVCLAHYSDGLRDYDSGVPGGVLSAMVRIGMVATPTFVFVSGFTLGLMLGGARGSGAQTFKWKLIDRCLFTLTIGHLLLVLAEGSIVGHFSRELRTVFITDIVAISTLVGLMLYGRLGIPGRLVFAGTSFLMGWLLWVWWHPSPLPLELLEEVLVGPNGGHMLAYGFPLLMWLGVHQASSIAGECLAPTATRSERRLALVLGFAGASILLLSFALRAAGYLLRHAGLVATTAFTASITSPLQKWPPSPVYLCFYGGAGLILISLVVLSAGTTSDRIRWSLAVVGRSSLATYIAQYFVFSTLVPLLGIPVGRWWPAYFLILIGFTFLLSLGWDARFGNRWLTLGVREPGRRRGSVAVS